MTSPVVRAERLARMLELFKAGHRLAVPRLAEQFEVSERTIRRDLICLQGYPFYLPLVLEQEWRIMPSD